MRLAAIFRLRLRSLFRRKRIEQELDEELRYHLQRQMEEGTAAGAIAGIQQRKEECRGARRVNVLEDLLQDVRYAFRTLRKSPGFTAVIVLTLTLGLGVNLAVFSVVNAVLLRPLPYPEARQLYTLKSNESLPDLDDIQSQVAAFAAIGGLTGQPLDYTGGAGPQQIFGGLCNAGFFPALNVRTQIGRWISKDDDRYGGPRVAVLSYGFWQRYFGGSPDVLGKTIPLSGESYAVIGVMPAGFWKPGLPVDVFVPLRVANPAAAQFRGVHFLETYLRMKSPASRGEAQSQMDAANRWLARHYPDENTNRQRRLVPLQDSVTGDVRPALLILFAAVTAVLLIACVNFANLLLARATARQREILTRTALGAGLGRLTRQVLVEGVLVSLLGGSGALLAARLAIGLIVSLGPGNLPRLSEVHMDPLVLTFAFVVCMLIGIVFGLIPALSFLQLDVNCGLREMARASTASRAILGARKLLVVLETALGVVLLIGTGLLVRSFWLIQSVDPGFHTQDILTMRLELPASRYREMAAQRLFRRQLLDSLNAVPNVRAAMISELPMSGAYLTHNLEIAGRPPVTAGEEPEVLTRTIQGAYFRLMGIPLLRGRDFTEQDRFGTAHAAIINSAFVRRYFPDRNPLGERICFSREKPCDWMNVVGVVGDVRHFGPEQPEQPAVYDIYPQTKQPWKRWMYLVIRGAPASSVSPREVQARVWAIDKTLPLTDVATMHQVEAKAVAGPRFNLALMAIFGAVALILAAVGVYGVMSYMVTQRTREIGLRMALGARRREVFQLVTVYCMTLTGIGVGLGIVAALALTRLMSSLLFGVSPSDPITFVIVALAVVFVALVAAWLPARRAMDTDPMVALRCE